MTPLEMMIKVNDMLEIPTESKKNSRNLKHVLYEIVDNLILESFGEGDPRSGWVERSAYLLRPDSHEGSPFNRQHVAPIYANLMQVYDLVRSNGSIETENMRKFIDHLIVLYKVTPHSDTEKVSKDYEEQKIPQNL